MEQGRRAACHILGREVGVLMRREVTGLATRQRIGFEGRSVLEEIEQRIQRRVELGIRKASDVDPKLGDREKGEPFAGGPPSPFPRSPHAELSSDRG